MKGSTDLVSAIHHIKQAFEHLGSFRREYPNSAGARLFKTYQNKLEWIVKDFLTIPYLPKEVADGIRKEWEADGFTIDAILEKLSELNPEQRDAVEQVIDQILLGEQLTIIKE